MIHSFELVFLLLALGGILLLLSSLANWLSKGTLVLMAPQQMNIWQARFSAMAWLVGMVLIVFLVMDSFYLIIALISKQFRQDVNAILIAGYLQKVMSVNNITDNFKLSGRVNHCVANLRIFPNKNGKYELKIWCPNSGDVLEAVKKQIKTTNLSEYLSQYYPNLRWKEAKVKKQLIGSQIVITQK